MVPRFRTCTPAMPADQSCKTGFFLASGECSISAWRVIAPKCRAPKTERTRVLLNKGGAPDEVQVHQVLGVGEAKFEQRNQTLSAGEKLRAFAELPEHGDRFLQ